MGYRAGSDTGSLFNYLMTGPTTKVPQVGMGATILSWTDRHAATIVEVDLEKKLPRIGIKQDIATRSDKNGMSDSQDYDYTPNPNATTVYYTFRKDGTWVKEGDKTKGGSRIAIGYRNEYYDFSF